MAPRPAASTMSFNLKEHFSEEFQQILNIMNFITAGFIAVLLS